MLKISFIKSCVVYYMIIKGIDRFEYANLTLWTVFGMYFNSFVLQIKKTKYVSLI